MHRRLNAQRAHTYFLSCTRINERKIIVLIAKDVNEDEYEDDKVKFKIQRSSRTTKFI